MCAGVASTTRAGQPPTASEPYQKSLFDGQRNFHSSLHNLQSLVQLGGVHTPAAALTPLSYLRLQRLSAPTLSLPVHFARRTTHSPGRRNFQAKSRPVVHLEPKDSRPAKLESTGDTPPTANQSTPLWPFSRAIRVYLKRQLSALSFAATLVLTAKGLLVSSSPTSFRRACPGARARSAALFGQQRMSFSWKGLLGVGSGSSSSSASNIGASSLWSGLNSVGQKADRHVGFHHQVTLAPEELEEKLPLWGIENVSTLSCCSSYH